MVIANYVCPFKMETTEKTYQLQEDAKDFTQHGDVPDTLPVNYKVYREKFTNCVRERCPYWIPEEYRDLGQSFCRNVPEDGMPI